MYIRRQRGLTLMELIVFIVIVSVALAGILTVLNVTARSGADPMIRKQALAIAEGLLEEVMLQPFTWCDPDDPAAATATGAGACTAPPTGAVEGLGAETVGGIAEQRIDATHPFDNVSDYSALALASPIPSVTGTTFAPAGYSATVAVTQNAPDALPGIAPTACLLVTVTVTGLGETVELQGYRTRHSPNLTP